MAKQEIDVRATTTAPPEAVWKLLGDSSTWPDWAPIDSYDSAEMGGSEGVGEIREFHTGRVTVREEIVVREPPRRLSYVLLKGLAVKNYRADIELAPEAGGTAIRWHTTFDPKVPGTGWLYRRALDKITRRFVDGLARHSLDEG